MPAPNVGSLLIALVVLFVLGTGVWFFIRSAARSGVKGAECRKQKADLRREMKRWEASLRNQSD